MRLDELAPKVMDLFEVESIDLLGSEIMKSIDSEAKLSGFCDLVNNDLKRDWLQGVYQYYLADREGKKQDFTPASLASLVVQLAGENAGYTDMCAGTGRLAIEAWVRHPKASFTLYELDAGVIPFLLFNLVVRNMKSQVFECDLLTGKTERSWIIKRGERFGKCMPVEPAF